MVDEKGIGAMLAALSPGVTSALCIGVVIVVVLVWVLVEAVWTWSARAEDARCAMGPMGEWVFRQDDTLPPDTPNPRASSILGAVLKASTGATPSQIACFTTPSGSERCIFTVQQPLVLKRQGSGPPGAAAPQFSQSTKPGTTAASAGDDIGGFNMVSDNGTADVKNSSLRPNASAFAAAGDANMRPEPVFDPTKVAKDARAPPGPAQQPRQRQQAPPVFDDDDSNDGGDAPPPPRRQRGAAARFASIIDDSDMKFSKTD